MFIKTTKLIRNSRAYFIKNDCHKPQLIKTGINKKHFIIGLKMETLRGILKARKQQLSFCTKTFIRND